MLLKRKSSKHGITGCYICGSHLHALLPFSYVRETLGLCYTHYMELYDYEEKDRVDDFLLKYQMYE